MVKRNPEKSYVADIDYSDIVIDEKRMNTPMTAQRKISLLVLVAGVCYMSFGLIKMGWYINQCAAVFMIISIVVGFVNRWRVNQIASVLTEGLSKGVLSAVVVGIARGILVVVTRGNIIDTIVHSCVALMESVSLYASALGMLAFQTLLNFLVPSGSGQAAVSMPIITPIADLLHLNRQIAVLIFQFGDGFSNLLWPTSFMLIVCAMVKIPVSRYYKWLIPFFLITLVLQIAFVFAAVAMNYGPF